MYSRCEVEDIHCRLFAGSLEVRYRIFRLFQHEFNPVSRIKQERRQKRFAHKWQVSQLSWEGAFLVRRLWITNRIKLFRVPVFDIPWSECCSLNLIGSSLMLCRNFVWGQMGYWFCEEYKYGAFAEYFNCFEEELMLSDKEE